MMNKISIVTSLYRSAAYVDEFYERHLACLKKMNLGYEFIFVDDGYPDAAAEKVKQIVKKDNNVKLILLSRNFGQYPAMFAGMAHATGNFVFTSDSDLEEPPENITAFYDKMVQSQDLDFLYAVTSERTGGIIRGIFGGTFYRVMKWAADLEIPKNMSWQIMMTERYKDALLQYKEADTLPAGIMMLTGFKQDSMLIDKTYKGSTSYTFRKRLKLAMNSITAFSSKPLVFIGILGILITAVSFLGIIAAIIIKLFFINYQSGWISIILSIWLVGGLILSSVGVMGIYLAKIFNQVKGRPLYIIKSIITKETETNPNVKSHERNTIQ